MIEIGRIVKQGSSYGVVTAQPDPEDSEKQDMVEVNLYGYGRQWLAEIDLIEETPAMRDLRVSSGISDQHIRSSDYPGGPNYTGY